MLKNFIIHILLLKTLLIIQMIRTIVIFVSILLGANVGCSQNTTTSDFPKYIDTGDKQKDDNDYAIRKKAWIEQNPNIYEVMTKLDETSLPSTTSSIEPISETNKDELLLDIKQPHLFISERFEVGRGIDIEASEKLLLELKELTFYIDVSKNILYRKSNQSGSLKLFAMPNKSQATCQDCDNLPITIMQQTETEIVLEVKEHLDDDFSVLIFFKKKDL